MANSQTPKLPATNQPAATPQTNSTTPSPNVSAPPFVTPETQQIAELQARIKELEGAQAQTEATAKAQEDGYNVHIDLDGQTINILHLGEQKPTQEDLDKFRSEQVKALHIDPRLFGKFILKVKKVGGTNAVMTAKEPVKDDE